MHIFKTPVYVCNVIDYKNILRKKNSNMKGWVVFPKKARQLREDVRQRARCKWTSGKSGNTLGGVLKTKETIHKVFLITARSVTTTL